ncbi:heparan-alpha-glucosaminide N-acetyltransferase [Roseiarcaceae bacterium H3SJ34-1]|uniref:heparan-alpha-glucosaminide N-acetyltransferase n=1 Tax=Terripilifer ovatus TaxID=3032367 RepID=UPI003AB95D41|nr:heparan-alpha-glucosaminide N-acetyltransferase [Roseiarcaceae bacterium H3SJ34-1]
MTTLSSSISASSTDIRTVKRVPLIDAARGAAIAGMFVYHFIWDLGFFAVIPASFPQSPGFRFFGHIVAATFLALVGISHAMATRGGLNWHAYLLRLATVVGAAALVTLATWYLFPEATIFFGILHCIVVASILALIFTRAPWFVTGLVALAIIAAPFLFASAAFDSSNWWLGMGFDEPRTNDWRPVFPWAGFTLAGLALAQAALRHGAPGSLIGWSTSNPVDRTLVLGGRHSLLIYLAHQPVLIAVAFLLSLVLAPRQLASVSPEADFQRVCVARCVEARADASYCARTCGCLVDVSKANNLWQKILRNDLSADEQKQYDELTQQCIRDSAVK